MNKGVNHIASFHTLSPAWNEGKIESLCKEFDSLFLSYLLKIMRKTIPKSGLLEGGIGEGILTDIIDQNLAIELSKREGLGLSSLLREAMRGEEVVKRSNLPLWSQGVLLRAYREPLESKIPLGVLNRLKRYDHLIIDTATSHNLSPNLIRAIIVQESGGEPQALSPKGAKGLMQLLDGTSKELGVIDPFNPEENIRGGCKYLRLLIDGFDGDLQKALAAYNAGPRVVKKYGSLPPIKETREYVKGVLNYKTLFDLIYPSP